MLFKSIQNHEFIVLQKRTITVSRLTNIHFTLYTNVTLNLVHITVDAETSLREHYKYNVAI